MDKKKFIRNWHRKKFIGYIAAVILIVLTLATLPILTQTASSGDTIPVGDIPGWHQIFADDFNYNVPLGSFPDAVSNKWWAYPDGWQDTSRNGTYYPSKVVSISNGIMNLYIHTEIINGVTVHCVSTPVPLINGMSTGNIDHGQLYGRYAIRFRADLSHGYKIAWLLWPDSETWPRDGEIDYPEGNLDGAISGAVHFQGGTSMSDAIAYWNSTIYDTNWHIAITEWTPNSVKFILDSNVIGNFTTASQIPNTPMHYVIQTETATDGTMPDDTTVDNVQIDWVSIYSPSYIS